MRTPRLRLLSAILAVALFFTLLPVSALAEVGGSNANTGLTIGIVGNLNHWDESHSISMKEVSPAVYEVTFENKSYGDINGSVGFLFVKDNSWDNSWGFGTVSSGELHNAVYKGDYITINPGSDAEESTHNFIIRLDLTNWDWDTKMGATFTVTVAAATNTFYFDPTTGTITKYVESDTVVVIPSKINDVTVETIGNTAFQNSAVTSVTIPDSVTAIYSGAFANCSQLTNISIPNSVTYIGFSAFNSCTSLKSITLPSSLSSISEALFFGCSQLTTIHIPVSVTSIGNYAFADCPSLMTVTYPGSKTQWDDDITKGSNNDVLENHLICAKLEATFTADGTTLAPAQTIDRGGKFTEPAAPSKENHTFAGWYNGDEKFDFGADTTNAPNVLELVAKWTPNDYYVSFVTEHGDPPTSQNVKYNGTAKDPGTLTEEGYTFVGWYADHTCTTEFDFTKPITGDTKVYAKWEKNAPVFPDTYELNVSGAFVYVDGVDVTASAGDTSLQLEKNASVRLVADPDRMPSGMVFDRWTILNGALNADDAEKFETGRYVRTRVARVRTGLSRENAAALAALLNRNLTFVAPVDLSNRLLAELCSQIDPELVPVISAAAAILQDSAQPHVFLGGEQYLLNWPQLEGKVGDILTLLNDEEQAAHIIAPPADRSESVLLGEDLEPQIPGLCIVSDRYLVGGGLWGTVALIGPTRMPFQKLMPLLHLFADELGEGMSGKRKDTPQMAAPRRTVIYKEDLE